MVYFFTFILQKMSELLLIFAAKCSIIIIILCRRSRNNVVLKMQKCGKYFTKYISGDQL